MGLETRGENKQKMAGEGCSLDEFFLVGKKKLIQ